MKNILTLASVAFALTLGACASKSSTCSHGKGTCATTKKSDCCATGKKDCKDGSCDHKHGAKKK